MIRPDALDRGELPRARRRACGRGGRSATATRRAVAPTWRMPRPTSRLASGRGCDASMRGEQVADRHLAEPSRSRELLGGQRVDVADGVRRARGRRAARRSSRPGPRCPSRRGWRSGRCACARWAGQSIVGAVGVGLALGRARAAVPHTGQCVGNAHGSRVGGRRASTGPTTSGITSPALRTITVSPGRTSLRATSSWLCNVALPTVEPPTNTGSRTANGCRPARCAR